MLDIKESVFSTIESRRNTEMISSRVDKHQFKYDINDYLPADPDYKPLNFFAIGRREQLSAITFKTSRIDENHNQIENSYKELIASLQLAIKQKQSQIDRLKKENQESTKISDQKLTKISKVLQQTTQKNSFLQKQLLVVTDKIKKLEENISIIQKQKNDVLNELNNIKSIQSKRIKNIRIFCQKYQLKIQPRIKQTYTIEVQTQKYLSKAQNEKVFLDDFDIKKQDNKEIQNSRKISCHQRPQFYQLYQKKQQNEQFDLNNQVTSRSQVYGSGFKPKKPAIMQNTSEIIIDKQNDRRRINQRIEGRPDYKQKSKDKIRVKNQEIELYPIEQSNIEDIVKGILALK